MAWENTAIEIDGVSVDGFIKPVGDGLKIEARADFGTGSVVSHNGCSWNVIDAEIKADGTVVAMAETAPSAPAPAKPAPTKKSSSFIKDDTDDE